MTGAGAARPRGDPAHSGLMPIHPDAADFARQTENEWQDLRTEASELPYPWAPAYRSLIEAAYAAPELRALYPFTSHWALRFSTTTRPELTLTGPCLTANGDGTYGVGTGFLTPNLGLFATPSEAVALAVRHLSS